MNSVINCAEALYRMFWRPALTRRRIRDFQDECLRRLIGHAYENVPYYRRLFDRSGIAPRDIRTASDLEALPITTKDDLRQVPVKDILARGINPDRLATAQTSGSTGEPFTVRRTWLEKQLQHSY